MTDKHLPQKDEYVKIIMRTGPPILGFVLTWDQNNKAVILTEPGNLKKRFILYNLSQDVLGVSVLPAPNEVKTEIMNRKDSYLQAFQRLAEEAPSEDRDNSLVELKTKLIELEKEEIQERLNSHTPGEVKEIIYALPNVRALPRTTVDTASKSNGEANPNLAGLQGLFKKR